MVDIIEGVLYVIVFLGYLRIYLILRDLGKICKNIKEHGGGIA